MMGVGPDLRLGLDSRPQGLSFPVVPGMCALRLLQATIIGGRDERATCFTHDVWRQRKTLLWALESL